MILTCESTKRNTGNVKCLLLTESEVVPLVLPAVGDLCSLCGQKVQLFLDLFARVMSVADQLSAETAASFEALVPGVDLRFDPLVNAHRRLNAGNVPASKSLFRHINALFT